MQIVNKKLLSPGKLSKYLSIPIGMKIHQVFNGKKLKMASAWNKNNVLIKYSYFILINNLKMRNQTSYNYSVTNQISYIKKWSFPVLSD